MVSKNTTLISVNKATKESLDKLKQHPSLSYNDVIVGLISSYRINNSVETEDSLQQEPLTSEEIKFTEAEAKTDTSTGN